MIPGPAHIAASAPCPQPEAEGDSGMPETSSLSLSSAYATGWLSGWRTAAAGKRETGP